MGADLDAGIAVAVAALDALEVILHVEVEAALAVGALQWHGLHTRRAVHPLGYDLPAVAVDNERAVLADETEAVVAAVGAVINAYGVVPQYGEVVERIYCLERVGRLARVVGVSELAACGHDAVGGGYIHAVEGVVEQVYAPVGHQTARIVPEPAPCEVKSVGVELAFGGGAQPHLVVDACGGILIGLYGD